MKFIVNFLAKQVIVTFKTVEVIMKKNEFDYVKEVANEQSFSKAAKKLGVSQPALSNYINKLEGRLGVLLFDRSISPIEITEFGKYYLQYADEVKEATDRLSCIISDLQEIKTGELIIGSTACFSTGYLPGPISEFNNKYPGVNIRIIEGKVSEVMGKCLQGEVDMFLSDADIDENLFDKNILFDERLIMVVPKQSSINEKIIEYRVPVEEIINGNLKEYNNLNLKIMKDEKFILLNEDQHIRHIVDRMFETAGFKPNVVMQVPQTITGMSMSIAGIGISFVAESTIKYSNTKDHPYYYKVGKDKDAMRTMCVAYKKGKYIPTAGKKFMETLEEVLGKK